MANIICPGCNKSFSINAWSIHLAQSKNPQCHAIYNQQNAYLPGADDVNNVADAVPTMLTDHDGDQFMSNDLVDDYTNNDDSQWPDATPDHLSSESSSDESEDWTEEPPTWEPPRSATSPSLVPSDNTDEDEHGRVLTGQERKEAEGKLWSKPFISEFPSARAGEWVEEERRSGYEGYKETLGSDATDNLYTPFNSKMDWEFARWAKLRGVGSTSATELMGIEGVCVFLLDFSHDFP
jgi:hypothetical protein